MDLEEMGISAGNWVDSAQDRNYWRALVNAALNLRFPQAMELVRKTHRPQPGLNPRTLNLEAITLPRDHRGRGGLSILSSLVQHWITWGECGRGIHIK